VNPSGKLPLTFPKSEADLPHPKLAQQPPPGPSDMKPAVPEAPWKDNTRHFEVDYDEGPKVGYKWYDAEGKQPLFPFGRGLSYTTYAYSDLKVTPGQVTFKVKNTGACAGAETTQVYVTLPQAAGEPFKRLVAWEKVQLAPGEAKAVALTLDATTCRSSTSIRMHRTRALYLQGAGGGSSRETPLNGTFGVGGVLSDSLGCWLAEGTGLVQQDSQRVVRQVHHQWAFASRRMSGLRDCLAICAPFNDVGQGLLRSERSGLFFRLWLRWRDVGSLFGAFSGLLGFPALFFRLVVRLPLVVIIVVWTSLGSVVVRERQRGIPPPREGRVVEWPIEEWLIATVPVAPKWVPRSRIGSNAGWMAVERSCGRAIASSHAYAATG
jgi:hypothetical protein